MAALRGRKILAVARRAKWLVLSLERPVALAIQVKMTGRLDVVTPETTSRQARPRRVRRSTTGPSCGCTTRASSAGWRSTPRERQRRFWATLGPEPLDDTFTLRDFRHRLRARRARLKTLLMDQAFLAGVGNIYADEALWRARLHPLRSAAGLRPGQERELYLSLRAVLDEAIERRGSIGRQLPRAVRAAARCRTS